MSSIAPFPLPEVPTQLASPLLAFFCFPPVFPHRTWTAVSCSITATSIKAEGLVFAKNHPIPKASDVEKTKQVQQVPCCGKVAAGLWALLVKSDLPTLSLLDGVI